MFIDKKIAVHLSQIDILQAVVEYAERALREQGIQVVIVRDDVTATGIEPSAAAIVTLEPRR
jgi:sulfur transfer complex TusBCD TusB component (DsrH family)